MTLDEFRATGVDCDDLGAALSDARWEDDPVPARGRLYFDTLYVERRPEAGWPNGEQHEWYLLIGRSDYLTDDLPRLEALLYEWAIDEGIIDLPGTLVEEEPPAVIPIKMRPDYHRSEAMDLVAHAKKLLLEDATYLQDARDGARVSNTVIGSIMSLTTGAPRQYTEQAVRDALAEIDAEAGR